MVRDTVKHHVCDDQVKVPSIRGKATREVRFQKRDVPLVAVTVASRRLDQARRDVNCDDLGAMLGEQAGQVTLATTGVKHLAAGDIARKVEQPASKPGHETPECSAAYEADVGLGVFVVAVHVSDVPVAPLTIDFVGFDFPRVPDSRPAARVESGARKAESES